MVNDLSREKIRQYYFVTSGVVFDFKGINQFPDDPCCISYDDSGTTFPQIVVDNNKTYYFDRFITNGDVYDSERKKFIKVLHPGDEMYAATNGQDEHVQYSEYFKRLCEREIELTVQAYFDQKWQFFEKNSNVFHVPEWFIRNNGHSLSISGCSFEITEDSINRLKNTIVKKAAYNAALNAVESYGYALTSPSAPSGITVSEQETVLEASPRIP